ncbi:hypothetical protein OROGR_017682 [Orobanche gracilis]
MTVLQLAISNMARGLVVLDQLTFIQVRDGMCAPKPCSRGQKPDVI